MRIPLCSDDPVVSVLSKTLKANVVRIPEERLAPLWVLARRDEAQASARGHINGLLDVPVQFAAPETKAMAAITGTRTKSVDVDLGLQILQGFLAGIGLGGASAAISAKFSGAQTVSFSFAGVERSYVEANEIGKALSGRRMPVTQPAAAIFFGPGAYQGFIIDSTITSSEFNIRVERSSSSDFALKLPEIQGLLAAETGVKVAQSSKLDISFQGRARLAFAFTALTLELAPDGRIRRLPEAPGNLHAARLPARRQLEETDDMLDLELPSLAAQ